LSWHPTAASSASNKQMVGLHWNGVGKQISGTEIIRPWSATWSPEARVAVLGANGSGKSTLIQLLSGQMPPSVGELTSPYLDKVSWAMQASWAGPGVQPPLDLSGLEWVAMHGQLRTWRNDPWQYLDSSDSIWSRSLKTLSSGPTPALGGRRMHRRAALAPGRTLQPPGRVRTKLVRPHAARRARACPWGCTNAFYSQQPQPKRSAALQQRYIAARRFRTFTEILELWPRQQTLRTACAFTLTTRPAKSSNFCT